jgi:pimeloyl-ACP methyl ester carboxylesterase
MGEHVIAPDRPQSGDLDTEIDFLIPLCTNATVLGVSGGATLGLELATRGIPMRSVWLHEPAAGSLAPGLLTHVAEGLATGGVRGFGTALYGSRWDPSLTTATEASIRGEFAMFGRFEPSRLKIDTATVTLSVGANSPASRFDSVRSLSRFLDVGWMTLDGVAHAAHLEGGLTTDYLTEILRTSPLP